MKIRNATEKDLVQIIAMLADDKLGSQREDYQIPLPNVYHEAFQRIVKDENNVLVVLEDDNKEILATLQLTFIQYLTYQGGLRAQIEAVRTRRDKRGAGLGRLLFQWAINKAKESKAHVLQLTTDKQRPEAFLFYRNMGFVDSHEGMKMHFKENLK